MDSFDVDVASVGPVVAPGHPVHQPLDHAFCIPDHGDLITW